MCMRYVVLMFAIRVNMGGILARVMHIANRAIHAFVCVVTAPIVPLAPIVHLVIVLVYCVLVTTLVPLAPTLI